VVLVHPQWPSHCVLRGRERTLVTSTYMRPLIPPWNHHITSFNPDRLPKAPPQHQPTGSRLHHGNMGQQVHPQRGGTNPSPMPSAGASPPTPCICTLTLEHFEAMSTCCFKSNRCVICHIGHKKLIVRLGVGIRNLEGFSQDLTEAET
jgi:hypothetical protein